MSTDDKKLAKEPCDYCGKNENDWRGECPDCSGETCTECSCGSGTAHFDCENAEDM